MERGLTSHPEKCVGTVLLRKDLDVPPHRPILPPGPPFAKDIAKVLQIPKKVDKLGEEPAAREDPVPAQAGDHAVRFETARERLRTLSPGLFEATLPNDYPAANVKDYLAFHLTAVPAATGVSQLRGRYADPLLLLLATSGIVLLILRVLIAASLYAFFGLALYLLWRDLQGQTRPAALYQPPALTLIRITDEEPVRLRFTSPEIIIGRDPACEHTSAGFA